MAEEGERDRIIPINIEEEMKTAYIDYSMSVIVSRALPDVRDGLKPVHRRVLYGMTDLGLAWNRPYKKSARIVGEVLGKYHPHGDSSVYDTMVRMAQWWSMRYTLVDGQGNFGSIDGDPPAAMRYTEARLTKIADEMLQDIDKDTVDFRPNFDDSLTEPSVMPAKIPNLLLNGASGIAVGMATNMPPHNLSEVVDGIVAYIDNNDVTIDDLCKLIKAPDFPTGGILFGYDGIKSAFMTGRGRVVIRGRAEIETLPNNRERIIVTEVPYQVNKALMVARTADLVNEKVIEGITEIRDESDRNGMRVVYEIKKEADANVVLNNLYKHTTLRSSFSVNNIALVKGRPVALNLKDMIHHYVDHRHEVVVRRTKFDLAEAEKRAHILEGLLIALDHLDEVIALIRNSKTPDIARTGLMESFALSEIQAKAILDLRLQRLTGLERDKIKEEYEELMKTINYLKSILDNVDLRMEIIKNELIEIKKKFGDARRSEVVYAGDELTLEDMVADEDMVITISNLGYIKRTNLRDYRRQNRGGRGAKGAASREEDFIEHLFVASLHSYMLFFTANGKCYWHRVYDLPEGSRTTKGRAIQNVIQIESGDSIQAYLAIKSITNQEYLESNYLLFCTKNGTIKKTALAAYSRPRQKGIIAINLDESDQLVTVILSKEESHIVIATKGGQAIRFQQEKVRAVGRNSIGVRGIRLNDETDDEVIGMIAIDDKETTVLVVTEKGYGKRTNLDDPETGDPIYRITNRGGKGVKTLNITDKTGKLVAILDVKTHYDLMIINKSGILIRMAIDDIRTMGRATQGVRLIKLDNDDEIASIAKIEEVEDLLEEGLEGAEGDENLDGNSEAKTPETDETEAGEEDTDTEETTEEDE